MDKDEEIRLLRKKLERFQKAEGDIYCCLNWILDSGEGEPPTFEAVRALKRLGERQNHVPDAYALAANAVVKDQFGNKLNSIDGIFVEYASFWNLLKSRELVYDIQKVFKIVDECGFFAKPTRNSLGWVVECSNPMYKSVIITGIASSGKTNFPTAYEALRWAAEQAVLQGEVPEPIIDDQEE